MFPTLLPSTFETAKDKDKRHKWVDEEKTESIQKLNEYFRTTHVSTGVLIGDYLDKVSGVFNCHTQRTEYLYLIQIRKSPPNVRNDLLIKFERQFANEFRLERLDRGQLAAVARLFDLRPKGNKKKILQLLEDRLPELKEDDLRIVEEGIDKLTLEELSDACRERGIRTRHVEYGIMREELEDWLELSFRDASPSLLYLSRVI